MRILFDVRNSPFLPCRVMSSPTRPGDVTPGLVRKHLADHPEACGVALSAAFLQRRPGSDVAEWRQLDQDLEAAGIPVYFTQGGTASWEVKLFVAPAIPSGGPRPAPAWPAPHGPEKGIEPVTPSVPVTKTEAPVLQPPPPTEKAPESVPATAPDGDVAGEPPAPIPAVTPPGAVSTSADRVLQPLPAAQDAAEGIPLDVRVGYLTALGHSTRKVAELLELEGYGPVSHMKVVRARRRQQGQEAQMPLGFEQDATVTWPKKS